MPKGAVKFFDHKSGAGLIKPENGGELVGVHSSNIVPKDGELQAVYEGNTASYTAAKNHRIGTSAQNVRRIARAGEEVTGPTFADRIDNEAKTARGR